MKEMLRKLSHFGGSLPHQPWPYWLAVGSVLLGAVLFFSTGISMSYDLRQRFERGNEIIKASTHSRLTVQPLNNAINLNRAELFGENPAGQASRLTLLGVGAAEDSKAATAIISIDGGAADAYSVGDKPIAGMAIVSISPDTVILLHDGVRQALRLDWGNLVNDPNTDFSSAGSNASQPAMNNFPTAFSTPDN